MAQTEILQDTVYTGFAPDANFANYPTLYLSPPPCQIEIGETYRVKWDGVYYTCVAVDFGVDPNFGQLVAIGNTSSVGHPDGSNDSAPFVMGFSSSVAYFLAYSDETTHTVGIYQEVEEPPDGLVLKDRDGNPVTYVGVVGVKMLNTNGELVEFMPKEEAEGGGSSDAPYITYTLDDTGEIVGAAMHGFTSVPASCFYNYSALTTVDFSDSPGITSIGANAFDGCTKLTDLEIPATVTSIGNYAFRSCKALTDIALPIGLTEIGYNCFYGCTGITSIVIPDNVTNISLNCFDGCTGLTSVTLNEGLSYISDYAFSGCTSLTEITIPDNVWCIYDYAFNKCSKLESVTFGSKLKQINKYAFSSTALTYAKFVVTEGWWYASQSYSTSGTALSATGLANTTTAATWLKTNYKAYYWKRT